MEIKKGIFFGAAVWVDGHLPVNKPGKKRGLPGVLAARQQNQLAICERLYGKSRKEEAYRTWRILWIRKILLVAVCGSILTGILAVYGWYSSSNVTALARPADTAEGHRYVLDVWMGKTPLGEIPVEVPAQLPSPEAIQLLLLQAEQELETLLPGDNISLEQVEQELVLPDTLCQGLVTIVWESSDFDVVDHRGKVNNGLLQEACVVVLTAHMTCQEQERSIHIPVRVVPPQRKQTQRLLLEINRLLEEESTEEKMQEWFKLPDTFENLPLQWSFHQEPYVFWILCLTLIGCAGIYLASGQDLQKEEQKRQQELLEGYPGFLARLAMLTGTGLPVRVVFNRLAADDRQQQNPVYEEIRRTCREMESGITQKEAFENFGRRCRLPEYKKCAALLTQHISRGSAGLLEALWQEAENACEMRRAQAKQKGETAQTKMLFPMLLLLLVVMVVVMVPACFSFAGM